MPEARDDLREVLTELVLHGERLWRHAVAVAAADAGDLIDKNAACIVAAITEWVHPGHTEPGCVRGSNGTGRARVGEKKKKTDRRRAVPRISPPISSYSALRTGSLSVS